MASGAYFQASGQKTALNTSAFMSDLNAKQSEQQARDALDAGAHEAQASMLNTAQTKSTQRANMAANGIDLSSESAQDVFNSTDYLGAVDKNTIEANAMRSAWGYRTEATNERSKALTDRATAKAISPTASAVTSLLGSAGSVSDQWTKGINSGSIKTTKAK